MDIDAFRKQFKNVTILPNDTKVPLEVVQKLPNNHHIICAVIAKDMDGKEYEALLVSFRDQVSSYCNSDTRVACFRLSDGSYMNDWLV